MPDFSFCPQCNAKYRTAGMPAFKRLRCKKCQGIFVVPEDSAEQSLAATPEKKPAAAQPDKDAEHAIPAAIGALGRTNFKGGVTVVRGEGGQRGPRAVVSWLLRSRSPALTMARVGRLTSFEPVVSTVHALGGSRYSFALVGRAAALPVLRS